MSVNHSFWYWIQTFDFNLGVFVIGGWKIFKLKNLYIRCNRRSWPCGIFNPSPTFINWYENHIKWDLLSRQFDSQFVFVMGGWKIGANFEIAVNAKCKMFCSNLWLFISLSTPDHWFYTMNSGSYLWLFISLSTPDHWFYTMNGGTFTCSYTLLSPLWNKVAVVGQCG